MLRPLHFFLGSLAVLVTASARRSPRSAPSGSWGSSVYQELFLWNNNPNTTFSLLNATCHSQCDTVHQTFKNCTTTAPHISQCLCTDHIGTELDNCVSCIAAVTDSKLLNFTAKLGLHHWYADCQINGHNVSQPQVNTTSGLALAASSECRNVSLEFAALGVLGTIMVSFISCIL
ncbi:hypothetical protein DFH08DRAFT_846200 [Mycena albidolilacea]|uniref:Uncharacterized protein n=1 Tax=Mycena albidolilacea TaxID=1033008 RepID=A0AAD7AIB1_9AGAR|nr:hypothetical protein DFH08DRAFT_846200 [Mycena albidolilacea]